jgi:DNA-binding CsgD family transcriptional regulator
MALTGSFAPSALMAHPHRFLGREPELERFSRRLESAASDRGGLVVLAGDPGVGKTTLVDEVCRRAANGGYAVLRGAFLEGAPARPYGALADALESRALGEPPAKVQAELATDAGVIVRICPRLSALIPNFAPAVPLEPADERLRLHEALVSWLRRISAHGPVLLVLDDMHAADGDTLLAVQHLAHRSRELRVLIVSVANRGVMRRLALEHIQLAGLDDGATAALLAQLADRPVAPAIAALIQRVTAGNPLFSAQLYLHLLEEGMLPGPGSAGLSDAAQLPQRFEDVIAWRASRLTGDSRTALNVLAALPGGASARLVATVAGVSRSRAVTALEASVESGLAAADEGAQSYRVVHQAVATALLATVPSPIRAQLHRRMAEAIEADSADRMRESASELAYHYAESSQIKGADRGLRYCLLAAEQTRAAYAYIAATDFVQRALKLAPVQDTRTRADVLGRLAVNEAAAGSPRNAAKTAHRLLDSVPAAQPAPVDTLASIVQTLRILRGTGVLADDLAPIEDLRLAALARVGRADTTSRTRLELMAERWGRASLAGIETLTWSEGQPAAARTLAETGDESDLAELMLPQRPRNQALTGQAAGWAHAWRRPAGVLRSLRCVATDLVTRHGLFREGAEWASQYVATAERYGALRDRAAALLLLARCRAALGELSGATDAIEAAVEALRPIPDRHTFDDDVLLSRFGVAHFVDGDWTELIASLPVRTIAGRPAALALEAQRALAHVRARDEADARGLVPRLLDAVALLPPLTYLRDAALVAALTAAWELGAAEYSATGQSLLRLAAEGGAGGQLEGSLGLTRSRLLALAGDVANARAAFAAERTALDASGQRPLRAIADHDEAIAIAASGPAAYNEAARLLETAAGQFNMLGMTGWLARTRRLIDGGLDSAAVPGGRLYFTYPCGLSRREADVVRLMAGGASADETATALVLERSALDRLLASALDKLGADRRDELPRLARRYGLGGT